MKVLVIPFLLFVFIQTSFSKISDDCELQLPGFTRDDVFTMLSERPDDSAAQARVRNSVLQGNFETLARNQEILENHNPNYSHKLSSGKISDQKQSGRCWVFGACNAIRGPLIDSGLVESSFEFSQSYIWFFSLFEKANIYFEELSQGFFKKQKDYRKRASLWAQLSDGGFWQWFAYLVKKYGLVPYNQMPDYSGSLSSGNLQKELSYYMTLQAASMKELAEKLKQEGASKKSAISELRAKKKIALAGVLEILRTHLGTPPTGSFQFRVPVKEKKTDDQKTDSPPRGKQKILVAEYDNKSFTARSFADSFVKFKGSDFVPVVYSRKLKEASKFSIADSAIAHSSAGMRTQNLKYLNLTQKRIAALITASIIDGRAIPIAVSMNRLIDHSTGIMHPDLRVREGIYNFRGDENVTEMSQLPAPLANYLRMNSANHLMSLTAVDLNPSDEEIVKFLIENSWGTRNGYKGFYHMYYDWFKKYSWHVVIHKDYLSEEELKAWRGRAKKVTWYEAF